MKTTKLRLNLLATLCLSAITFYSCSSDSSDTDNNGEGEGTNISYNYSDVSKVFVFHPAPGQFVNELPKYEEGDTQEIMNQKALKAISGEKPSVISLGGFGGYIEMGFKTPIKNIIGQRDFSVLGNAFENSSEPGIILVGYDKNGNGKPDTDEWYEIVGSEHSNTKTIPNYKITYFKPSKEHDEQKGDIPNYIKYENNQNEKGYKAKNKFHEQSYYPLWNTENQIAFSGTRLPNNAVLNTQNNQWALPAYAFGYADNHINGTKNAAIDIDWAVDSKGNKASLKEIHFIKIYTALDQEAGWLGETSTEVSGVIDLHKAKVIIPTN